MGSPSVDAPTPETGLKRTDPGVHCKSEQRRASASPRSLVAMSAGAYGEALAERTRRGVLPRTGE